MKHQGFNYNLTVRSALSYCWGGPQPVITTCRNAQDNTDGILFSSLPKTIQDAIFVTSELGIRYLWVDCLCIIQDDPEDVAREISLMAQIFEQAFVTISAASAASVHEGFLSNQNTLLGTALRVSLETPDSDMVTVLVEREQRTRDPANDPINLRAWTLQEHILASRMLIYGTEELWWTCESSITHSKGEEDLYRFSSSQETHRRSLDYWRSVVHDYSRRFLTYPNDKLPALAGIAAHFSRSSRAKYLAGLWDIDLLGDLMWCSNRSGISRPVAQRAPSWSWASVDGEVHHNWCPLINGEYAAHVEYCYTTPVLLSSPFGRIDTTRSALRITGELTPVIWLGDRKYIYVTMPVEQVDGTTGVRTAPEDMLVRVGRTQADAMETLPAEGGYTTVWVLPIMKEPTRGLLLLHLRDDEYRRVGLVLWMRDGKSYSSGAERRTISIR
jgi:hypothetical protein